MIIVYVNLMIIMISTSADSFCKKIVLFVTCIIHYFVQTGADRKAEKHKRFNTPKVPYIYPYNSNARHYKLHMKLKLFPLKFPKVMSYYRNSIMS